MRTKRIVDTKPRNLRAHCCRGGRQIGTNGHRSLHRTIEQTEGIFEAVGGICQRNTRAGARLLKEFRVHNDDAGVLHEKLCALATTTGFLLNAEDLSMEKVGVLLDIPPEQPALPSTIAPRPEMAQASVKARMRARTYEMKRRLQQYHQHPCALLLRTPACRN